MGRPAAKEGDLVTGLDFHATLLGVPVPSPFSGPIVSGCSPNVKINGLAAALKGALAQNSPIHELGNPLLAPGIPNQGTVTGGSETVKINGVGAVRSGDTATTCNAIPRPDGSSVVASSTVKIGG